MTFGTRACRSYNSRNEHLAGFTGAKSGLPAYVSTTRSSRQVKCCRNNCGLSIAYVVNGEVHPISFHEDRGWVEERVYSFINLAAKRGWVVNAKPHRLYPLECPGTHCTGGWVGPMAGLVERKKSITHPQGMRSPHNPALAYVDET